MAYGHDLEEGKGTVQTPIAEHIVGNWELVESFRKEGGKWESTGTDDDRILKYSLRPDGEFSWFPPLMMKHTSCSINGAM